MASFIYTMPPCVDCVLCSPRPRQARYTSVSQHKILKGLFKRSHLLVIICSYMNGLGITAGAHRLWAHKTYKANTGLTIFLMICQSLAFQNHIYEWVRDHRVHHKFTDTNADPHNARRGNKIAKLQMLFTLKRIL